MAYYELTYFDNKHAWWSPKLKAWLHLGSRHIAGCSSHRRIGNNGKEAWRIFRKEDPGAILVKFEKVSGHWFMTEYELLAGTYKQRRFITVSSKLRNFHGS